MRLVRQTQPRSQDQPLEGANVYGLTTPMPILAPEQTTGIMLVDDEDLLRSGLKETIARATGLAVVAETGVGHGAVALADRQLPDVVVLGVSGHNEGAAMDLVGRLSGPRVVMLANHPTIERNLMRAIRVGAGAILLRSVSRDELIYAIRQVAQGHNVLQPPLISRLFAGLRRFPPAGQSGWAEDVPDVMSRLSRREQDVLSGIATGLSNQEIAQENHLTVATVKSHVSSILTKLGARDRLQAALMCVQFNLLAEAD